MKIDQETLSSIATTIKLAIINNTPLVEADLDDSLAGIIKSALLHDEADEWEALSQDLDLNLFWDGDRFSYSLHNVTDTRTHGEPFFSDVIFIEKPLIKTLTEFTSSLEDWNTELDTTSTHRLKVTHKGTGLNVLLDNGEGELTSVYIEINNGKPAIHISSNPENDNDVHIYVESTEVRVQAERGDDSLVMPAARNTLDDEDSIGPR